MTHPSQQPWVLVLGILFIVLAGCTTIEKTGKGTSSSPTASLPEPPVSSPSLGSSGIKPESKDVVVQSSPEQTQSHEARTVEPQKTSPEKTSPEKPDGVIGVLEGKPEGVPEGVRLIPQGAFTDDDLIVSMTILKFELGIHPELKMTDITHVGKGKDSVIVVGTSLSSTKPLVATINAVMNRERFEGKLGKEVLFNNNDVRFICKIPACAGVEDMSVCAQDKGGFSCTWAFGMVLWEPAAKRIGEAVKGMPTRTEGNDTIVSEPINLYLNGQFLDYVYVPADNAGTPITDMTISGNETGQTPKEAQEKAVAEMDRVRDRMGKKVIPIEMKVIG